MTGLTETVVEETMIMEHEAPRSLARTMIDGTGDLNPHLHPVKTKRRPAR